MEQSINTSLRVPRYCKASKEYQELIKQIRNEYARKSFGWAWSYEELEQELWTKFYSIDSRDIVNQAWLAKVLRNHINNWLKKEIAYERMFVPRMSFEGTPEERPSVAPPGEQVFTSKILKTYILAFHIYKEGLSVEMRDFIGILYGMLSTEELQAIDTYAYESNVEDKTRQIMKRALDRLIGSGS